MKTTYLHARTIFPSEHSEHKINIFSSQCNIPYASRSSNIRTELHDIRFV